jgi:hypothetical protein
VAELVPGSARIPARIVLDWDWALRRRDGKGAPARGLHRIILAHEPELVANADELAPEERKSVLESVYRGLLAYAVAPESAVLKRPPTATDQLWD